MSELFLGETSSSELGGWSPHLAVHVADLEALALNLMLEFSRLVLQLIQIICLYLQILVYLI